MSELLIDIIFAFILVSVGAAVGSFAQEKLYQAAAVEHNCAQYNPQTGEFEWLRVEHD